MIKRNGLVAYIFLFSLVGCAGSQVWDDMSLRDEDPSNANSENVFLDDKSLEDSSDEATSEEMLSTRASFSEVAPFDENTPTVEAPKSEAADEKGKKVTKAEAEVPRYLNRRKERRFDILAKEMPVNEFYLSLVSGTSKNIIIDSELKGSITMDLTNVTITEALTAVRDVYGYEFKRTSYGYHIVPNEIRTKVLHFNYLEMSRSGTSNTKVSSGSSSDSATSSSSSTTGEVSASGSYATNILTQNEANFWGNLTESLEHILGNAPGRKIIVNSLSGVIVVTGMPHEIAAVEDYLKKSRAKFV